MALTVSRQPTAEAFLAAAGEFLARREAEHNLIFGICSAIRVSPETFGQEPPRFLTVTDAVGRVVATGLRTPPHHQYRFDRQPAYIPYIRSRGRARRLPFSHDRLLHPAPHRR